MTASKPRRAVQQEAKEGAGAWALSWGLPAPADPWWGGWEALTTQAASAALAGIDATDQAIAAWRRCTDVSLAAVRTQQDAMLSALRSQLEQPTGEPGKPGTASRASGPLAPMLAAAQAYGQIGEAVLEAQRGALESLSNSQRPH